MLVVRGGSLPSAVHPTLCEQPAEGIERRRGPAPPAVVIGGDARRAGGEAHCRSNRGWSASPSLVAAPGTAGRRCTDQLPWADFLPAAASRARQPSLQSPEVPVDARRRSG